MSLLLSLNGVRSTLASAIDDVTTALSVNPSLNPWKAPPDPSGNFYYLTLVDSDNPTKWERVKVIARSGAGPYSLTVARGVDSNTGSAQAFNEGVTIQWVPGGEEFSEHLQRDGSVPLTGDLQLAGHKIKQPELQSVSMSAGSYTLVSGVLTLDLATGNNFDILLTEDADVQFSNTPASGWVRADIRFEQDATGGRKITYPESIHWPSGTAPTHTTSANGVDFITLLKPHGSSTWVGINACTSLAIVKAASSGYYLAVASYRYPYLTVYQTIDWSALAIADQPPNNAFDVAFNSDGTRLAVLHNPAEKPSAGNLLTIYDTTDFSALPPPAEPPTATGAFGRVFFSPNGSFLAVTDNNKHVIVFNTSDWSRATTITFTNSPNCVVFSSDNSYLAVGTSDSPYLAVYHTSDWSAVTLSVTPTADVDSAAFSPDGNYLAVGYEASPYLMVLNTADWTQVASTPAIPSNSQVTALAFSPAGTLLAAAHTGSPFVTLCQTSDWALTTGPTVSDPEGYLSGATSITFSQDGTELFVGFDSLPNLLIFKVADWSAVTYKTLPPDQISNLALTSDGALLSGSLWVSPGISTYHTSDWTAAAIPASPPPGSVGIAYSSAYLAAVGLTSPYLYLYDRTDLSALSTVGTPPSARADCVAFSPDGSFLAVGCRASPYILLYTTADWVKMANPGTLPASPVYGVAFNPAGTLLAVACAGTPWLIVYNTTDWSTVTLTSPFGSGPVASMGVKFSPDGNFLIIGATLSPYCVVYKTSDWSKVTLAAAPKLGGGGFVFSADSTKLYAFDSSASPAKIAIYDTTTWTAGTEVDYKYQSQPLDFILTQDGKTLISASDVSGLRFFDATTLVEQFPLGSAIMGSGYGVACGPYSS